MSETKFKHVFFRFYDRKIAAGEITFAGLALSKADFVRLCSEEDFVLDEETILRISEVMRLTEEEKRELLAAAASSR